MGIFLDLKNEVAALAMSDRCHYKKLLILIFSFSKRFLNFDFLSKILDTRIIDVLSRSLLIIVSIKGLILSETSLITINLFSSKKILM